MIGDGGQSNGENVKIWDIHRGRICLHLNERGNL